MLHIILLVSIVTIICLEIYCKKIIEKENEQNLTFLKKMEYDSYKNKMLKFINNRQIELNIYKFHQSKVCSNKGGYLHYPNYKSCDCGWILK